MINVSYLISNSNYAFMDTSSIYMRAVYEELVKSGKKCEKVGCT